MRIVSPYRRLASSHGSAFVEMAVALPFLLIVIAGAIDFGRIFYTSMALTNAARAGAQYGSTSIANTNSTATIQTKATTSVNLSGVNAVATVLCQCFDDVGTPGAVVACTTAPATACSGASHRLMTVTVTASKTYNTVMSYPGIPSSIALSRTSKMRVSE